MSGFRGDDDDLDDLTLWAGRLRPWPASPAVDGVDDDTVRSRRTEPVDGDTAPRRAAEPDDETLRSRRARAAGGDPGSPSPVDPNRHTSPRSRPADSVDRTPDSSGVVEPEEQTSPRSRPRDSTGPGSRGAVEPDERTSPRSRLSDRTVSDVRRPGAVEAGDETLRSVNAATGEYAATGESIHPRSGGAQGPFIAAGPPEGRDAHAPVALHRESYAPRLDAPVRVSRAVAGRVPHTGDAASSRPRRAPDRGRLIVLATAVVAVMAVAVVGLILLLG